MQKVAAAYTLCNKIIKKVNQIDFCIDSDNYLFSLLCPMWFKPSLCFNVHFVYYQLEVCAKKNLSMSLMTQFNALNHESERSLHMLEILHFGEKQKTKLKQNISDKAIVTFHV